MSKIFAEKKRKLRTTPYSFFSVRAFWKFSVLSIEITEVISHVIQICEYC